MLARLTGAPELLARLTGSDEVAGEGLPGAPKWLAKLDLICASRRIIACSIQSHWFCPIHASANGQITRTEKQRTVGKSMVNDHHLDSRLDSRAPQF